MVIRMSRPIARPESRHLYARKRIPADIKRILATIPDWPRPAGWGQDEIVISTGPHQLPGETPYDTATRLYAEMTATFVRLRNGPQDLTDAQIGALAGEVYELVTGPPAPSAARAKAFSLASFLDRLMADKGLWLTASARDKLVAAIMGKEGSLFSATALNGARARGDFSTPAASFPTWQNATPVPAASPVPPSKRVSLATLAEQFLAAPRLQDKALSRLTIRKYRTILDRLTAFLGGPDARTVTEQDIRRYLHSRLTEPQPRGKRPITARTLHKGDLPAIKSLFTWATNRDQHDPVKGPPLMANPAAGIKIKTDADLGIIGNDNSPFTDDEVALILNAALAVTIGNEDPALDRAKRWVPWIAAYTGSRIEVICGLTGADFVTVQGIYCMTFPPRKGFPSPRRVPVHEHLLEQGIKEMVAAVGIGPLFYEPPAPDAPPTENTPAENRASRISKWVREIGVTRPEAAPSHSWRDTFITRSAPFIPEAHCRQIAGHTPARMGVHGKYHKPSILDLAASLTRFPRYALTPTDDSQDALGGPQAAKDGRRATQAPAPLEPS